MIYFQVFNGKKSSIAIAFLVVRKSKKIPSTYFLGPKTHKSLKLQTWLPRRSPSTVFLPKTVFLKWFVVCAINIFHAFSTEKTAPRLRLLCVVFETWWGLSAKSSSLSGSRRKLFGGVLSHDTGFAQLKISYFVDECSLQYHDSMYVFSQSISDVTFRGRRWEHSIRQTTELSTQEK